jgi:hypothetical protein
MKTQRHKYQYQFPLKKGNTLNVIHLTRPEIYILCILFTIIVCTHTTKYHWEVSTEISTVSLWRFRPIDLHNTIYNGIDLAEKKDQTSLEDMASQIGYTVNVGENERKLATATSVAVHELFCTLWA